MASRDLLPVQEHPQTQWTREPEFVQVLKTLMSIDLKPNECHKCGSRERLWGWNFGLGKRGKTHRDWTLTAGTAIASAIMLPLIGIGGVVTPSSKTMFQVLPLRLNLCDRCKVHIEFSCHPWWKAAQQFGYVRFFASHELGGVTPFLRNTAR